MHQADTPHSLVSRRRSLSRRPTRLRLSRLRIARRHLRPTLILTNLTLIHLARSTLIWINRTLLSNLHRRTRLIRRRRPFLCRLR